MQLQIDIITIKFGIKLSQQQDILWKLYRKCQLPEIKSDKNLIDDFYKVTGAINCYTVSTCNEYLRSRWNRIFKNALTTTPLDWSITQIELEGIAYPKTTSRHLERTINKLLLNCNVELAEYAYKIWRAETPLCLCRVEAESVTHYLFFCVYIYIYRHTPVVCNESRKPHTSHFPSRPVAKRNQQTTHTKHSSLIVVITSLNSFSCCLLLVLVASYPKISVWVARQGF